LISSFAHAADFSVSARQVRSVDYSSSGANVDYSLQARFAANDPRYKTTKVKYGPAKVLDFAKSRKTLNPAAAAVNAVVIGAVAAAGWAIDELTNQVTRPNSNPTFEDDGSWQSGKYWLYWNGLDNASAYAPTASQLCSQLGREYIPHQWGAYKCYGGNVGKSSLNIQHQSCGSYYSTSTYLSQSGCGLQPSYSFESVPESEWWPQVMDAISQMSPEAQREFWNNIAGMPELTPELQSALDDWNSQLESETGETGEVKEETSASDPQDISTVRIDPENLNTSPIENTASNPEDYDPMLDQLNNLPTLPELFIPDVGLDFSPSCETINFSWRGASVDFPTSSQCAKLNDAKQILGWFLNVVTMFGCAWIILGNRGVSNG
jgi:hypothetical protein